MKNQAYYDSLEFNPNAVSEKEEFHVEQQFRDSWAKNIFSVLFCIMIAVFFALLGDAIANDPTIFIGDAK